MRRVDAQFRPRWRPGRLSLAMLCGLAACTVLAGAAALWQHHRVLALRDQIAQLEAQGHAGGRAPIPRPTPAYDASAKQFLVERSAQWAPMLRTLESASMIGVTPTSVEFDASSGTARVQLSYSSSAALFDYLGRINEGVSTPQGAVRWSLLETRQQPGTVAPNAPGVAMQRGADAESIALIQSTWADAVFAASSPQGTH